MDAGRGVLDQFIYEIVQLVIVPDDGRVGVQDHIQVVKGGSFQDWAQQYLLEGRTMIFISP